MKPTTSSRPTVLMLIGALVGILALGVGVQAAFSKPKLASPTITAQPAPVTSSKTASFSFTGPSGATFRCSLDGAAYVACTSPRSYSALGEGSHTFRVKSVQGSSESDPAAYTWTVDTVAPVAPTLTEKPATLSNTADPTFAFTHMESTVSFRCSLDGSPFAACSTPVRYSGLAQGAHSFSVRAVDAAGNVGPVRAWSWTVDVIAPAAPVLTTNPSDPSPNATNDFAWTASESGLSFECSLNNGSFAPCASPYRWVIETGNYGQKQFAVRAVDAAGNVSTTTEYRFKYEKGLPDSGIPFEISGTVGPLNIGIWRTVELRISNPNSVPIFVTALQVDVASDSTPPGCLSATNLQVQQSSVSGSDTVTVPANGSVLLPAQGVSAPRIRLVNLPSVNQDVCKGKSFDLSFSGTATN